MVDATSGQVVDLLRKHGTLSAREMRLSLNEGCPRWASWSVVEFYSMMAELEDQKLVRGFYQYHEVDGQRVRVRFYSLA